MKRFLFLLIVSIPLTCTSQEKVKPADSIDTIVHYLPHPRMYDLRYSLGVFPEVQFINSPVIGISASYARLLDVEWSAFGRGVNVGVEFDPLERFYGPKATVWGALFVLVFGVNASFSAMYYFQGSESGLYFRPEIGIGIPCIHLKYGFGFRVAGDELTGIQRHSLTLGAHIPVFKHVPRKRKP